MPATIVQTNSRPFEAVQLDSITLDIIENALRNARAEMDAVTTEAQGHIGDGAALDAAAQPCEGAIFVRSAVLEACAGSDSRLCRAAARR